MHTQIETIVGHVADFRVRYRFYTTQEGGRIILPHQGYRSDFWYDHDGAMKGQVFMIWPEFENSRGEVMLESNQPVPESGTARMWVINPQRRPYHRACIKLGMLGYFIEGSKRTAECSVIEIVGLHRNPIENLKQ